VGFIEGETYVKMKKLGKKKSLASSWEGLFLFMKYLDNNGFQEQDKGGIICVFKGKDENLWEDLEGICRSSIMYHKVVVTEGFSQMFLGVVTHVAKKYGLGFLFEKGLHCCYLGAKNYHLSCRIIMQENMYVEEVLC